MTASSRYVTGNNHAPPTSVSAPSLATEFKVCVRIRPLLPKEKAHVPTYRRKSNSIIQTFGPQNEHLLRVYDSDLMYDHTGARDRQFAFHEVFSD